LRRLFIYVLFYFIPFILIGSDNLPHKFNEKNFSYLQENSVKVFYDDGKIIIKGIPYFGNISIFSIIGNPIFSIKNQNLENFVYNINLPLNNLFIIRIQYNNKIRTFKIVTK
tara:strand:- start:1473 stop:1808 length:336 start_codon:yes stop_codon:yes gene_type:complete